MVCLILQASGNRIHYNHTATQKAAVVREDGNQRYLPLTGCFYYLDEIFTYTHASTEKEGVTLVKAFRTVGEVQREQRGAAGRAAVARSWRTGHGGREAEPQERLGAHRAAG